MHRRPLTLKCPGDPLKVYHCFLCLVCMIFKIVERFHQQRRELSKARGGGTTWAGNLLTVISHSLSPLVRKFQFFILGLFFLSTQTFQKQLLQKFNRLE